MVLLWGKCRSGSTPLANVFGVAGIPSFFQPVKNVARHVLVGRDPPTWQVPVDKDNRVILVKETAGPYVAAEALLNPLELLIGAGYPADRIHLLVLERDPYRSFGSWLFHWSTRREPCALLHNFVIASLNMKRLEQSALCHGVPVTHFVHEASRRPLATVQPLFERLGLGSCFHTRCVTDWADRGALGTERSGVVWPKEPPMFQAPTAHSSGRFYQYRERSADSLNAEERDCLDSWRLPDLYRQTAAACARDLGLDHLLSECLSDLALSGQAALSSVPQDS